MRILRIKLRNFRGVAECEVRFPRDGVSIVAGDNEVGKSSIAMAIDALIEHLDSSKRQEVLALKPVHRDEGAEVEADIEAGAYEFTYFKRFHRQQQTKLTIRSPRPENLSGREAHERAVQIFAETVDMALWKALRIEQGSELLPPDLSAQKRLSAALDAAAGSAKATEGNESLYDAAHAETLRYFTENGSERKDFRQRGEESTAAAQAATVLRERLRELERDIESSESLEQQLMNDEPELVRLRKVETERQQAVLALAELDSAVATAEAKLDAAQKQLGIAEEQARQREKLRSDVVVRQRAQEEAQEEVERERSLGSSDAASSDQASRAVAEAVAARDAAEGRLTLARKDLRFRQSEHDLTLLSERLERVERAQVKLARADQMLEGPRVQDDDLKALRSAGEEVAKAKAVLQTESPRLRLAVQRKLSVELDGERREVAPGATVEAHFSEKLALELPELARLEVLTSQGAAEQRRKLSEAERAVGRILERLGVTDEAAATRRRDEQRDALKDRKDSQEVVLESLRDLTELSMREKIARLETEVRDYPKAREVGGPLPSDVSTAKRAEKAAEDAFEEARKVLATADNESKRIGEANRKQALALARAQQKLATAQIEWKGAVEKLEVARAERADAQLEADVNAARQLLSAAESAQKLARAALSEASPEETRELAGNAKKAADRAEDHLKQQRQRRSELKGKLEAMGEAGLAEQLDAATAKSEQLARQFERDLARASAAKLLFEMLDAARAEARSAYVAPLREQIERLGRLVFGPTLSLHLSEELAIVDRTLDQVTVPFEQLSGGTREQLGILARLACAILVSKQGGAPVILDDTLGYTDDSRLERMGAAISQAGRHCQVIILTCMPRRYASVGEAHIVALERSHS